jgi:preprotein translocase subunit SecA
MRKIINNRDVKNLEKIANEILNLDIKMRELSDFELGNKTFEFKERLSKKENLEGILIEAFAVAREASFRVLGKKHYKVQLIGGIALHQGRIIEMKTGEGKTLTELCPAYLNALTGEGVHIITVNDYLATRDMEEMKPFFNFLNLSIGLVIEGSFNKKEQYLCDVTYSTNTELGFDYLRDNIVFSFHDKVQRKFNFVIIDEVDSVLIDEARTPLIISGRNFEPSPIYKNVDLAIKSLKKTDYIEEKKEYSIILSESGIEKMEKIFNLKILTDLENTELNHIISQSLKANYMLECNKDYIVSNGEVILVDVNGRLTEGRRLSDGLHQCLEAKEGVDIKAENKTLATITYQNFFRLYSKVSGMSGTVKTEEMEFKEIYNLDVVMIPTNKPIKRIDNLDIVFLTYEEKMRAILDDVVCTHSNGNPILIGTPTIEESEKVSKVLTENGVVHNLLNAKTNKDEASIIAKAGKINSITVATNIAGRGTDIKISEEVEQLGGLKVIGVERTESRRIDNQLIGRAGRQGNSGMSQFYLSCSDELLDVYGSGTLKKTFENRLKKGKKVSSKFSLKAIEKAQKVINGFHYESRKYTLKYDFMVNKHRNIIYKERDLVLCNGDISMNISNMILEEVFLCTKRSYEKINKKYKLDLPIIIDKNNIFDRYISDLSPFKEEFFDILFLKIHERFKNNFSLVEVEFTLRMEDDLSILVDKLTKFVIDFINIKFEEGIITDAILRNCLIYAVDNCWVVYLDEMDLLKKVVKDQSYNQKDPIDVYKLKSIEKFDELNSNISELFVHILFEFITSTSIE